MLFISDSRPYTYTLFYYYIIFLSPISVYISFNTSQTKFYSPGHRKDFCMLASSHSDFMSTYTTYESTQYFFTLFYLQITQSLAVPGSRARNYSCVKPCHMCGGRKTNESIALSKNLRKFDPCLLISNEIEGERENEEEDSKEGEKNDHLMFVFVRSP